MTAQFGKYKFLKLFSSLLFLSGVSFATYSPVKAVMQDGPASLTYGTFSGSVTATNIVIGTVTFKSGQRYLCISTSAYINLTVNGTGQTVDVLGGSTVYSFWTGRLVQ